MVVATIQIMPRVTKQEYTHYLPALTSWIKAVHLII